MSATTRSASASPRCHVTTDSPPPAATSFAVSSPSPREPPTTSARIAANSSSSGNERRSAVAACGTGPGRTKAFTVPAHRPPETSIVTAEYRSSVRVTCQARLSDDPSTSETSNPLNSECSPGHSMPTRRDSAANCATAGSPTDAQSAGNAARTAPSSAGMPRTPARPGRSVRASVAGDVGSSVASRWSVASAGVASPYSTRMSATAASPTWTFSLAPSSPTGPGITSTSSSRKHGFGKPTVTWVTVTSRSASRASSAQSVVCTP